MTAIFNDKVYIKKHMFLFKLRFYKLKYRKINWPANFSNVKIGILDFLHENNGIFTQIGPCRLKSIFFLFFLVFLSVFLKSILFFYIYQKRCEKYKFSLNKTNKIHKNCKKSVDFFARIDNLRKLVVKTDLLIQIF